MQGVDFYIQQGDNLSQLEDVLKDANGDPVNLSQADSVELSVELVMQPLRGGALLGGAGDILDDGTNDRGRVQYAWRGDDTAEPGLYLASWILTTGSGESAFRQTYPNGGYLLIHVGEELEQRSAGIDYIAVEELKSTLNLRGTGYVDEDLRRAISAASRAIDLATDTRYWLGEEDEVRLYTARARSFVEIDAATTITRVRSDDVGDGSFATTWLESDYQLEPPNAAQAGAPFTRIHLRAAGRWHFPRIPNAVEVTGTFGWPAVPVNVEQATVILAGKIFKRGREAPFGIVGLGAESGSLMRIARNDPDVMALIGDLDQHTILVSVIRDTREAIARALELALDLQVSPYLLSNPTPPTVWVYPGEVTFDVTAQRGRDDWSYTVQLVVPLNLDTAAQETLDEYLDPYGPRSVKEALERDRTLGGLCNDLNVISAGDYGPVELPDGTVALGCSWQLELGQAGHP